MQSEEEGAGKMQGKIKMTKGYEQEGSAVENVG